MRSQIQFTLAAAIFCSGLYSSTALAAESTDAINARIDRLEAINRALIEFIKTSNTSQAATDLVAQLSAAQAEKPAATAEPAADRADPAPAASAPRLKAARGFVGFSGDYSAPMLNHTENTNTHQLLLLKALMNDEIESSVTLSGRLVALANWQTSNRASKFGWLMRHPTSANEVGGHVSEVAVHSVQIGLTAAIAPAISAYAELQYMPEQSFGAGTNTALARNVVEVRRAYALFGDLQRFPVYAAIGKMEIPFGLNDTVSPFSNTSNWHAFAGLANGAMIGYADHGLHVRAMAIQGGAQFRAANAPVEGTSVPSRTNNAAVDASYTASFGSDMRVTLGGSYLRGSAYCQAYPVTHFSPCATANPAWAVYGTARAGRVYLLADFARTTKVWPGTHVPNAANPLSAFAASRTSALTLGARYTAPLLADRLDVSFEFSSFRAGPAGAPWHRQNQWVGATAFRVTPTIKLFGEFIRTEGYAPLNFISGGNFTDGSSWSDDDARSSIVVLGVDAAF